MHQEHRPLDMHLSQQTAAWDIVILQLCPCGNACFAVLSSPGVSAWYYKTAGGLV